MAARKKLTPLEIASQLREQAKNPMDPSLRKLIKKAADTLISLSTPPVEPEEESFFHCCGASSQGEHSPDCTPRPSMAKRAKDAE